MDLLRFMVIGILCQLWFSCAPGKIHSGTAKLLVSNSGSSGVAAFDMITGYYEGMFIEPYAGGLIYPDAITELGDGRLIVSSGCRTTADSVCLKEMSSVLRYDRVDGRFLDVFAPAFPGLLYRPYGSEVGPDGQVYIASLVSNSILKYNVEGAFQDVFAHSDGNDSLGLNGPNGIAFDRSGTYLYVTTEGATFDCDSLGRDRCIVTFTGYPSLIMRYRVSSGDAEVFAVPPVEDPDNPPSLAGIIIAPDDKLYVADFTVNVIRVYNVTSGIQERAIPIDVGVICGGDMIHNQYLGDLTIDNTGHLYLSVGGTDEDDPGSIVRIVAPEYQKVECFIPPTSNLDRPVGLIVLD